MKPFDYDSFTAMKDTAQLIKLPITSVLLTEQQVNLVKKDAAAAKSVLDKLAAATVAQSKESDSVLVVQRTRVIFS